jgi:hypothetical protein
MGIFQNIRAYFNRKYLQEILTGKKREARKPVNLDSAKSIGILFDGTDLQVQNQILEYANELRMAGKKVVLLGALESNEEDGSLPFPSFSRKMLDWAMRPKGKAVEHFLDESFDLLIHLNAKPKTTLDFIAAQAKAHLKIGPFLEEANIYDLMIDHENASVRDFIREMEALLKKTNTRYAYA